MQSSQLVNLLKQKLCKLTDRENVELTGNATTAIYCLLKGLGLHRANIAIPNGVCFNVPLAIIKSGNIPFYVDISIDNLGMSSTDLEKVLDQVDAVIAVHTYGSICDIQRLNSLCDSRGIPLIEDFASAQGAVYQDRPVGSFGIASVLSFGAGKIIDAGHGGAIFCDDSGLMEQCVNLIGQLPGWSEKREKDVENLSKLHTGLYNSFYASRELNQHSKVFRQSSLETAASMLTRFDESFSDKILSSLEKLDAIISDRKEKNQWLSRYFSSYPDAGIEVFQYPKGSVPWRFNLFLEQERDSLLKHLLSEKYKVSSWYPSVDLFFEHRQDDSNNTPVSDNVGDTILNLWINEEIDNQYLHNVSAEISSFLAL